MTAHEDSWLQLPPARSVRLTPLDAAGLPTGEPSTVLSGRYCVEVWSGDSEIDSYFRHGGPRPAPTTPPNEDTE